MQGGRCKCEISLVCGGGGLGFGLVRNHVRAEKLCLLITMSSVILYTISSGLSLGGYG